MLDQRRVATQPDEKRERLFTERYESLLAWALRLTNQQRESAEDLVQDAFVQFMLGRTRLEEIENIDGYLRRMLRYMHVARMSRSVQQLDEQALSVADYDTCWLGWTAIEPSRSVQASEELHQICTYACSRKQSSKAGSVLILRFFLDYFPTEIARVLNSSRHSVDELQRVARREAKLFMNEPRRLRFVNVKSAFEQQQIKFLKSDCDLMIELRRMIFDSCHGECLSRQEFEKVYSNGSGDGLTTTQLAHVVSCPKCLDVVNSVLGLPLLSERQPAGDKEPPPDSSGGGASGGGTSHGGDLSTRFGRRLRETHEHKPQELRIAVNGFLVSSLKVSSELSQLELNLTPEDPIEFVEVCSEQGLQLLFFTVNSDGPQDEQWAWIELSEGRFLEASFRNDNGRSLRVIYDDPVAEEDLVTCETPDTISSSPLFVVPAVDHSPEPITAAGHVRSWAMRMVGIWRSVARRRPVAENSATQPADDTLVQSVSNNKALFVTFGNDDRKQWRRRVSVLVVLISAVMIAGLLFFKGTLSPKLTATMLLERASDAEQSAHLIPDKVRHRNIRLEERRSSEGAIVAQRTIEVWENRASGKRSQKLYDDSNKLIAGAWQEPDGSRTVYHHGSKSRPEPGLTSPANLLLNLEDVWRLEPSAETFSALIAEPSAARVEERSTTYVLTYDKPGSIGATLLLKATLTLSKADLHSIEQTLLVQRGSETREYRFVEAAFELLPLKDIAPAAFEIEPELIGGAGRFGGPGDWAIRDLTSSRVPPSPSASAPPPASAELEVDVAYLLNQEKADLNEQVALTRSVGGSLRVEGVVDSQKRKDEFLRALAPVSNNPAVTIDIRTVAEAAQRPMNAGSVSVHRLEETSNTIAADEKLRAYFEKRDPSGPTEDSIREYSSRMVQVAYRALFHAIELKKLVNRFANVDMHTVAPDARAKWLRMVHEHAGACARETSLLFHEMQPVFFTGAAAHASEDISIRNDAELADAVMKLHQLALSNNEAIRSAFTISAHSSAANISSSQFPRSLLRVESVAVRIGQYE